MPSRAYYAANAERLREYNTRYLRGWRAANPERSRGYDRTRDLGNPDHHRTKANARKAVYRAIAAGVLVRPDQCGCGRDGVVMAHHEDYARPLDVLWLCGVCHKARHEELQRLQVAA